MLAVNLALQYSYLLACVLQGKLHDELAESKDAGEQIAVLQSKIEQASESIATLKAKTYQIDGSGREAHAGIWRYLSKAQRVVRAQR